MKKMVFTAVTFVLLLTACHKDIVTEPDIIECWTAAQVPVRILSASGVDLLNRSHIPSGELTFTHKDIQTLLPVKQPIQQLSHVSDTFFFSIPMIYSMDRVPVTHVMYLLRPSRTDTISIQYSPASSKLYGIERFSFNKRDYNISELFKGRGVMGYEVREEVTGQ